MLDYESGEDTKREAAERRERVASFVYGTIAACAALAFVALMVLARFRLI